MSFNKYTTQRGATLLIAILVASVALAVGLGVYNRVYKELLFGGYWKQTQVAFAAADSGLECALYLDTHAAAARNCFGGAISWPASFATGTPQTISTTVSGACVSIEITKNAATPFTTIRARGYNDACTSTSPRRVERGLRVDY